MHGRADTRHRLRATVRWRYWKRRVAKRKAHALELHAERITRNLRHRCISARPHVARRTLNLGKPVRQQSHASARRPT